MFKFILQCNIKIHNIILIISWIFFCKSLVVALRAPWNQKDEQNCRRLTQTFWDEASFYSCAAVVAGSKSCRIAVSMLELYCIVCSAVEKDLRKQLWNRNLVVFFYQFFSMKFFFQQCSLLFLFIKFWFDGELENFLCQMLENWIEHCKQSSPKQCWRVPLVLKIPKN